MKQNGLMILIAGPYRSETNSDPVAREQNLRKMEDVILPIFRAGHIPVIGDWFARPLLKVTGTNSHGNPAYDEILYSVTSRIVKKCDAILSLNGSSRRSDEDVMLARVLGIPIYYNLADLIN
jgi:hypothetical protein